MLKLIFLVWLMHPQYRGALQIYTAYIGPYLRKHEKDIDAAIERSGAEVQRRMSEASDTGLKWLSEKKDQVVQRVSRELARSLRRGQAIMGTQMWRAVIAVIAAAAAAAVAKHPCAIDNLSLPKTSRGCPIHGPAHYSENVRGTFISHSPT